MSPLPSSSQLCRQQAKEPAQDCAALRGRARSQSPLAWPGSGTLPTASQVTEAGRCDDGITLSVLCSEPRVVTEHLERGVWTCGRSVTKELHFSRYFILRNLILSSCMWQRNAQDNAGRSHLLEKPVSAQILLPEISSEALG